MEFYLIKIFRRRIVIRVFVWELYILVYKICIFVYIMSELFIVIFVYMYVNKFYLWKFNFLSVFFMDVIVIIRINLLVIKIKMSINYLVLESLYFINCED